MNFLCVLSIVLVGLSHYATAQWFVPGSNCPNGYTVVSGDSFYKIAGNNYYKMCAFINANPNLNPCSPIYPGECLNVPQTWTSTTCPTTCGCCGTAAAGTTYYGPYYGGGGSTGYWGYTGAFYYNGCQNGQYPVQAGNTFFSLGGSTITGMCAWRNANPGLDPCNLQIGQCINQPTSQTSTSCSNTYTSSYSCGYTAPTFWNGGYYTGPTYGPYNISTYCNCGANQYCVKPGDTLCAIAGNTGNMCAWFNTNSNRLSSPNSIQIGQCLDIPTWSASQYCSTVC